LGSPTLTIETGADFVITRYPNGGEALVQLVRDNKHLFCVLTTGCNDMGACTVDQLPLGFSILNGRLVLMLGPEAVTEAARAVEILTSLIEMNAPGVVPEQPKSA